MNKDILDRNYIQTKVNHFFEIHIKDTIDSTNDALKRNAHHLNDGFVLIANQQTKGRGRNNNSFLSPSNNGIYLSIYLKPNLNISNSLKMVAYTSLAVVKTITQLYDVKAQIKWVNDILINDKKVCGILCESSLNETEIDYMVVGIGINLHSYQMNDELKDIASCIEDFDDKYINRNDFIINLLNNFYDIYTNINDDLINEYKKYSCILNQEIKVIEPHKTYICKAVDIDNNACLIVEKDDKKFPLVSGEIHIRKIHS